MKSTTATLTIEEKEQLKETLKRCSQATIDAAIAYQSTKDTAHISTIVMGIIERFLEPDVRTKLHQADSDGLRLFDDLGIDSLTMVEIIMLVEETLHVAVDNEDLRDLRTIADVNCYIECKIQGIEMPKPPKHISVIEINETMPHQLPFLFVQEATLLADEIQGIYQISGSEFFLQGHFKDNPVFPASIMLEALGQLAVLYIIKSNHALFTAPRKANSIYFTSCNGVRVQRICRPGDTLKLFITLKKVRYPIAIFEGSIKVNGEKTAFVEEICLTFDYLKQEEQAEQTPSTESKAVVKTS